MSYHLTADWRNNRNQNLGKKPQNYNPMFHSIVSYATETKSEKMVKKSELNEILHHNNYLTHLHMLPNPLQKNLGDGVPEETAKTPRKVYPTDNPNLRHKNSSNTKEMPPETFNTTFGTISSFLTGVFNVITSAMPFQRRPKTPDRESEFEFTHDGSPPLDFWLPAKVESQNKNNCRDQLNVQLCPNTTYESANGEMSSDCHAAVVNCEDKLNKVRMLLVSAPVSKPQPVVKRRRPKKVFVDPNSVEESFEDAFTPEDFVRLSNDDVLECVSPCVHVSEGVLEAAGAKMKCEVAPLESMDIVKLVNVPVKDVTEDGTANVSGACVKNGIVTPEVLKKELEVTTSTRISIPTENAVSESTLKDLCTVNATTGMYKSAETVPKESTDTKTVSKQNEEVHERDTNLNQGTDDPKAVIIQSCEDKVSRLKALLQERRKNNTKINQQSTDSAQEQLPEHRFKKNKAININKSHNKHYKNPNRLSNVDKRIKSNIRRDIRDDMSFANELDIESSSVENSPKSQLSLNPEHIKKDEIHTALPAPSEIITESPKTDNQCYFNEVSGRFRNSSTTESEDSFQIVFTDSPQLSPRARRLSDCDSEDSFIIFEDVPGNCYTSADVFGHSTSETEYSDYDTDDSEPTVPCKLSHNLSRTVSDLTDDSLYSENAVPQSKPYSDSEDEVDSSVKMADPVKVQDSEVVVKEAEVVENTGLLLDAAKKLARKNHPPKKVHFSTAPPKVLVMRVWSFAARQARAGHWEQHAVDRERFKRKIADVDMAISWVLKPQHRNRVKFQRFMPWWHAERRRELAEKKEREAAEEKKRLEEEQRRIAEEEERKRVEEERRLVALEEERKRLEKERLKAEEKRLKELNRKRLLEQHMKSEEQKATEVSKRRAENERRRKEEERYRIEAKQVAEELKKKMADEKRLLELEIERLEAEKVKLEGDKVGERTERINIEGNFKVNEVIKDEAAVIGDKLDVGSSKKQADNVGIEEDNKTADLVIAADMEGKKQENVEGEKATKEEHHNCKDELRLLVANQESSLTDSTAENVCNLVTKTKESADNSVDKSETFLDTGDEIVATDKSCEINIINANTAREITADDCKDSPAVLDNVDGSITTDVIPEINIADTVGVFVDCVDKLLVSDDNYQSVIDADKRNFVEPNRNVTKTGSGTLEHANSSESFETKAVLEKPIVVEGSKEDSLTPQKEGGEKVETAHNNVRINNKNTVKPAMKKIQFIQNQFSPINVVKSNVNKLNSQNVDKNMNNVNINHAKRLSVHENLNIEKQN